MRLIISSAVSQERVQYLPFDLLSTRTHHVTHRYLVIPGFLSPEDTNDLLTRSKQLLDEFDVDTHPLVSSLSHFSNTKSDFKVDKIYDW